MFINMSAHTPNQTYSHIDMSVKMSTQTLNHTYTFINKFTHIYNRTYKTSLRIHLGANPLLGHNSSLIHDVQTPINGHCTHIFKHVRLTT